MPSWTTYEATIEFRDRVVGGIPIIPEGADRADEYEKWARGQEVENDPSFAKPLHEALAQEPDMPTTDALEVAGLATGFRRDNKGLYIEARQVKAMLKEAAQRLGYIKAKRGARQVLQHDIHVRSRAGDQKLYLGRDKPDGEDSRPISVVTRQGPRTAIKRFEYVEGAQLTFQVRMLAGGIGDGIIGETELSEMLELGGELGLGADRSQGEGTFHLVSFSQEGARAAA